MSIFKRLKRLIKSNANAALDKAEDPMKLARQQLIDYDEAYQELRSRTVDAVADKNTTEKAVEELKEKVDKAEKRARTAVKAGNDGDAKRYLLAKKDSETQLAATEKLLEEQSELAAKLQKELEKLAYRIEQAKLSLSSLKSKQALVEARKKTREALSPISMPDGTSLDLANDYIDREIAKLDADEALAQNEKANGDTAELDEKYDKADLADAIDKELEQLKAENKKND